MSNRKSESNTRFNYSVSALDKAQFRGRTVPAQLVEIEEVVRPIRDKFVPGILITYVTPSGSQEQQLYEGVVDSIPAYSDLGKLMQAFAAMGVNNIAEDNFGHVHNKYLLLKVDPIRNSTNGSAPSFRYRRLPLRWLDEKEMEKAFGKTDPLSFLIKLVDELEVRLDGVTMKDLLPKLITDEAFRDDAPAIDTALTDRTFIPWLEQHTRLRLDKSNMTLELKERKKNGTATGS